MEAAFDSLANNFANNLFLNDEKEIFNENLGSVKVKLTDLKSVMKANNRPGAPSFNPGPSLVNLFSGPRKCQGGKTCQGVVVQVVQYKKDLIAVDKDKQDDQVDVDHTKVKLSTMPSGCNQFRVTGSPSLKHITEIRCLTRLFCHRNSREVKPKSNVTLSLVLPTLSIINE